MTAERWQKVESLFHSVLTAPPDRRSEALDQFCGGDESLRVEVEALLESHEQAAPGLIGCSLDDILPQALVEAGLHIGQRLGSYEVVRSIGEGGMGQIYEGRDLRLGRKVAIKVLPPAMSADPEMSQRFEREARMASSLNHPNILTIYDVGEFEGRRYLVTEFVEGETVRDRISAGALSFESTVSIVRQAASALQAAHRAGIVHRDIKPENMILRPDGVLRLIDFGLARLVERQAGETQTQIWMGTVPYMSPEQLRRERTDSRTDLWSLGVVLYEMSAGRPPFIGETQHHVSIAILEGPVPPLPQTAAAFESIVKRTLTKDREQRYQTAGELLEDVETLAASPAPPPLRARPRTALVWTAAILAMALTGAFAVRVALRSNFPRSPVVRVSPLTTNGSTGYAAISADGRFLAYTTSGPKGRSLWVRQVAETRDLQLVPDVRRFGGVVFSRSGDYVFYSVYGEDRVATLFRLPVIGGAPRIIARNVDSPVAISGADKLIAFVRITKEGSALITVSVDESAEHVVSSRNAPDRFREAGPAWSPDGSRIAAAVRETVDGKSAIYLKLFPSSGGPAETLGAAWYDMDRIAWNQDGRTLFVTGRAAPDSSQLFSVAYPSGKLERITADLASYYDVTAQADGVTVSAIRSSRTSYLVTGSPARRLNQDAAQYSSLAPISEDRLLTISDASGHTEIWMFDSTGLASKITTDGSLKRDVSACAATGYILYASNQKGGWSIWRTDRDGRNALPLTSADCCDLHPQCSPDGRTVLFESNRSGRLSAWTVSSESGGLKQLTTSVCQQPTWSPDGKSFACHYSGPESSGKWSVAILPANGGAPSRLISGIARESALGWDPRGGALFHVVTAGNVSNLWRKPLDESKDAQLTHFEQDRIFQFAQSEKGVFLFLRGMPGEDAVRISISGL